MDIDVDLRAELGTKNIFLFFTKFASCSTDFRLLEMNGRVTQ